MNFDWHYLLFLVPIFGLSWFIHATKNAKQEPVEYYNSFDEWMADQNREDDGSYAEDHHDD